MKWVMDMALLGHRNVRIYIMCIIAIMDNASYSIRIVAIEIFIELEGGSMAATSIKQLSAVITAVFTVLNICGYIQSSCGNLKHSYLAGSNQ